MERRMNTPMPSTRLPQQVLDLRAKLASSDYIERIDAVAKLVGLPCYKEVPRPGEASGWTYETWAEWGKRWEFKPGEESTHAKCLRHVTYKDIIFSCSKTPGDFRGMMRAACDFRKILTAALDQLSVYAVSLIDRMLAGHLDGFTVTDDSQSVLLQLCAALGNEDTRNAAHHWSKGSTASPADGVAWSQLPGALKILDKELGLSARQAFAKMGIADVSERVLMAIKFPDSHPIKGAALILHQLRQLIEELRTANKLEIDQKQAQRAALRDAKEKAREPGSEDKYHQGIQKAKTTIRTYFAAQITQAENLVTAIKRSMEQVDTVVPFPEYPGAPTELLEHRKHILAELDSKELECDSLKERINADAATIAKLERDRDAAEKLAMEGGSHIRKAARELVETIASSLSTSDIMLLVQGIGQVRAKAASLSTLLGDSDSLTTGAA